MPNRRDPEAAGRRGRHTIHALPPGLDALPWELPRVFLGLDGVPATHRGADTWILPVPYEATTSWGSGTRFGPRAIIDASRYVELFDPGSGRDPSSGGIYTFPALELTRGDAARAMAELGDAFERVLDAAAGRRVVVLGGEHAVSSPLIDAHARRCSGRLSVLQFDAHLDLREDFDGSEFSHACAMGRIVDRVDLTAVGARGISREEWEAAERRDNVTVITGSELRRAGGAVGSAESAGGAAGSAGGAPESAGGAPGSAGGAPGSAPAWLDRAMAALGEDVYITFDVDFLDPSIMPSTGTPEPGGGTWDQALALLGRVFAERCVVGADVVELAPIPGLTAPDFLAAKLVCRMIGYWGARDRM